MTTITPHRDLVEKTLADFKREIEAGPIHSPAHATERALTISLNAAVMRAYADSQDAELAPDQFAMALKGAMANAISSYAWSLAGGDRLLGATVGMMLVDELGRAVKRRFTDREVGSQMTVRIDEKPKGGRA